MAMALTVCIDWHTSTHRLQRMQAFGSLTKEGEVRSTSSNFVLVRPNRLSRTPSRWASACNSQERLRSQAVQSNGWLANSSSTFTVRAWRTRGVWVRITIASVTVCMHERTKRREFSTSTTQIPHDP